MKNVLSVVAVICAVVLGAKFLTSWAKYASHPGALIEPREEVKTFAILPSETLRISNNEFKRIEIRSEFPVDFEAGTCYNTSTVQWTCRLDHATDFSLRDLRLRPIFRQPQSNTITVTVSTY